MAPDLIATLILASQSAIRADILSGAGLDFIQMDSGIDEAPIKKALEQAGESPAKMAQTLAAAKSRTVSLSHPEALVIGADQVLVCQGRAFDKPANLIEARGHLEALRGRVHALETAVAVFQNGSCLWHFETAPELEMRKFSDRFLTRYLERVGDKALWSVGGYQIEGPGITLFERIQGDYFSILGLPILPLLNFLRRHGRVET